MAEGSSTPGYTVIEAMMCAQGECQFRPATDTAGKDIFERCPVCGESRYAPGGREIMDQLTDALLESAMAERRGSYHQCF